MFPIAALIAMALVVGAAHGKVVAGAKKVKHAITRPFHHKHRASKPENSK